MARRVRRGDVGCVPRGGNGEGDAPPMIDVALDARLTSHMSAGMKAYVRELTARLPIVAPDLTFSVFGHGDNFDLAEQIAMPLWIARHRPRIVHLLSHLTPLVLPRPHIVTVHDLIELRYPEFGKRKARWHYRYVVGPVVRSAVRAICDDEKMTGELRLRLGVEPARIRVVPLGVSDEFFAVRSRAERARPYALYVGNHRPHKNLESLLAAWSSMGTGDALDLYFTGKNDIPSLVERYPRAGGNVVFLGDVDEDRLISAYLGARAYVHPSFFEGFGLPLVEAASLGVPVIAANEAIPEGLRPDVLAFAPLDVAALRAHLERAASDVSGMREIGLRLKARANDYRWDRCATQTAAVYREVLA
jgi:glycosyltransferase involved in cell wall biosynthesis